MKFLFSLVFIACILTAFGQEQLKVEKKPFVSDEGLLYWPGNEPVYLFAGMSPNASEGIRIQNSKQEGADPMYLDTEGPNYVRSRWAFANGKYISPKQEVTYEIYKDSQSPITKVVLTGAKPYKKEGTTYYGSGLTLTISASDKYAGVKETYMSKNGGAYAPFSGQINADENGEYTYLFYSVDNVGNVETPKSFTFTIDKDPPSTSYTIEGDQSINILSPRTKIRFTGADNTSGIQSSYYTIDGGTPRKYVGPVNLTNISEGEHDIAYYSLDMVGNKEEPKTYAFYLDRTAPEVEAKLVGDQYQSRGRIFISSRTKLQLVGSDNKAGVKSMSYKVDAGPEIGYREPFEMPKSKGQHTVEYFGTDKVNNDFKATYQQGALGKENLDVDLDPPTLSFAFKGNTYEHRDTVFITSDTKIELIGKDGVSGMNTMGYKVDNRQGENYSEPIQVEQEGFHTVDFFGTDQVNNRGTKMFSFFVDNTGPDIETILSSDPIGSLNLEGTGENLKVFAQGVKVYLGATDKKVDTKTIFYRLNGGTERVYSQPIAINTTGEVTLQVRALDLLDNESKQDEMKIFIK